MAQQQNNQGGESQDGGDGAMSVRDAGKMGGEIRKEQLGPEGYSEMGKLGGERVRELVERGKDAEGGASSGDER